LETHKIALLYAGPKSSQSHQAPASIDEASLLNTGLTSDLFVKFQQSIGSLVPLAELESFSGGLDTASGADGEFALVWRSGGVMLLFHTPTLMPQGYHNRKRHVGNDFVHVLFAETGIQYDVGTISGDYGIVTIIVTPFKDMDQCQVEVKVRSAVLRGLQRNSRGVADEAPHSRADEAQDGLRLTSPLSLAETIVVPWANVAPAVQQRAVRADIACRVIFEEQMSGVSNWEERLAQMERIMAMGSLPDFSAGEAMGSSGSLSTAGTSLSGRQDEEAGAGLPSGGNFPKISSEVRQNPRGERS